jgi:hypothetical protein
MSHTPIGSGMAIDHEHSDPVRPRWVREGPHRYRAEISGCDKGSIVRMWQSDQTYTTAAAAERAAIAKAEQQ